MIFLGNQCTNSILHIFRSKTIESSLLSVEDIFLCRCIESKRNVKRTFSNLKLVFSDLTLVFSDLTRLLAVFATVAPKNFAFSVGKYSRKLSFRYIDTEIVDYSPRSEGDCLHGKCDDLRDEQHHTSRVVSFLR